MSNEIIIRDFLKKIRLNNYIDKFTKLKITTIEIARKLTDDEISVIFPINANCLADRLTFKIAIAEYKIDQVIYYFYH